MIRVSKFSPDSQKAWTRVFYSSEHNDCRSSAMSAATVKASDFQHNQGAARKQSERFPAQSRCGTQANLAYPLSNSREREQPFLLHAQNSKNHSTNGTRDIQNFRFFFFFSTQQHKRPLPTTQNTQTIALILPKAFPRLPTTSTHISTLQISHTHKREKREKV